MLWFLGGIGNVFFIVFFCLFGCLRNIFIKLECNFNFSCVYEYVYLFICYELMKCNYFEKIML